MKRHPAFAWFLLGSALMLIPITVFLKTSASNSKSRPVTPGLARLGDRATVHAAGRGAPRINLADGREVLTAYAGDRALQQLLEQNLVQPLAVASGDFDEDGVPDLISAYAGPSSGVLTLHRGNVDAIYPHTTEANFRKAQGSFTDAPFLSPARLFSLPVSPDFIGAGDFSADGHLDLAAAARGGHSLYLLAGNGNGGFGSPESIELPGAITAMKTGEVNRRDGLADVIVGIITSTGPQVLIFQNGKGALRAEPESFALPDAASDFALGQFDSDALPDLAIAAGHNLIVLYGRDREAAPNPTNREAPRAITSRQSFPFTLQSLASGDFTGKPQASLAALSGDGAAYLLSATFKKQRNAEQEKKNLRWKTQTLAQGTWSGSARLLKAKVSSLPQDDLLLIDSSNRQLRIIEIGNRQPSGQQANSSSSGRGTLVDLEVEDEPVAALPMRLNADAIDDLVILRKHNSAPAVVTTQSAMIFTVLNNADSSLGSLRQAIMDANTNPGADTIIFMDGTGPQTINLTSPLPAITEAVTIDGTSQPGFAGSPLIELNGFVVPAGGSGLSITSGNCTVRALVINRFTDNSGSGGGGIILQTGGNNLLEGNFIGTNVAGTLATANFTGVVISDSSGNTVGGMLPSSRNVLSGNIRAGVFLAGASTGNQIQGNFIGTDVTGTAALGNNSGVQFEGVANNTLGGTTAGARNIISKNSVGVLIRLGSIGNIVQGNFIGTDVSGTVALANDSNGVTVQDSTGNTIGGTAVGAGNVISGNGARGLSILAGSGNLAQGNFIGTNAAGTAALGNSQGLSIADSPGNTIGGTAAGARNIISGNDGSGIMVSGSPATGNQVQGNFIGTDSSGAVALANNGIGVVITNGASNNSVGGAGAGAGNIIAFNNGVVGVVITGGTGNAVLSNSIFSNAGLGIDISDDAGITPNDLCDGDVGANNLQNFPVLTSASSSGGNTTIVGTLNSTQGTTFRIEFFSSATCDPSGNGEGQTFIGFTTVSTLPAICDAAINVTLPVAVAVGNVITATATDPSNNTSEFSHCVTVIALGPVSDLQITKSDAPDPVVTGTNITYTITVSNLGPDADAGVTFTDVVPAGTTFVSLSSPGSCSTPPVGGTGTVTCSLGALASGGSVPISLVVNVNAAPGATITNTAMVSGMSSDPNSGNNSATANTAVIAGPCTITCPPAQIQSNDPNQCGAVVTYPPPTTAGPCGAVTCAPASGSFFPKGTTGVTCTTAAGPSCIFNVTVNDTQPPTITCPANVTRPTDPNLCSAVVGYAAPTVSDNCPGVGATCNPPSGSTFPKGMTTVNCSATDSSANTTPCSFTVTVNDTQPPTITCPSNVMTTTSNPGGTVVSYTAPVGTDNCPGPVTTQTVGLASGSTFPIGTTTNTFNVTDTSGNNAMCTFTVTVTLVPCTITCPGNVSRFNDANQCGAVVTYPDPIPNGSCGAITCSPGKGAFFPVGTTVVTCTAVGGPSCTFNVTVVDITPPRAFCPPNISTSTLPGQATAVVNYPAATATDNCTGASAECSPPSGSRFPVGFTLVTCTATDLALNTANCIFSIIVSDGEAPVIRCPSNVSAGLPSGQTSAVVNYPPPTVTDNLPGVNVVCSPASGSSFPAGVTTVTCTATDAGGNKSSCGFTVSVGGAQIKVTIPGNKTAVEFAADPTRKAPKPKKNPCSFFTIENIGFAPLILTFDSIKRTGADFTSGRIIDPNDSRFFTVSLVNSDQSLTQLDIGAVLTLQPGQSQSICAKFAALIPASAGKTTGLAASNILPDTLTSTINFTRNIGPNLALVTTIPLLARVSTALVLVNLVNPKTPPEVSFTRSGDDITVSYAVFDSNLDVSRAKYEFLNANGQVVAGPFETDLTAPIRSLNLVKGQSFSVDQRFTGASSNPDVTGVRLTVFDGETSVSATASATSISAASIQLMNRMRRVTLYLPDVKLSP
jgi:uncharacterized repeat protein (TIGR01451 family)